MIISLIIGFVFLICIGIPISFVLCILAFGFVVFTGIIPAEAVPHKMWSGLDQYVYTAIPMFMLSGEIMNEVGVTQRLVKVAVKCVGWIAGGLAHVAILSAIIISGISGSAVADSVAIGTVLIPAMKKKGFRGDVAAAIVAAATVNGPIIPPSNAMVVYSAILGLSVGSLFIAGIVPGILIGLSLMVIAYIMALKGEIPKKTPNEPEESSRLHWLQDILLPLSLPVIIIGGVLWGVATATEIAAVAVLASGFYGFVVYRALSLKSLIGCVSRCIMPTAVIFFLIAGSGGLGIAFTVLHIPEKAATSILDLTNNKWIILLLINGVLLFMGAIMDASANLLILAPILAPVAVAFGVDPLHFAIMFIVNVSIGMITPPVGSLLFTVCPIAKTSLNDVVVRIWPFFLVEVAVLLIITFIPSTVIWVPKLLGIY